MARTRESSLWKRAIAHAIDFAGVPFRLIRGAPPSGPVRRILVLELWNIGDVVLTLPFLGELRALFPEAEITFVGKPHAAEILAHSSLVDEVMAFDFPWTSLDRKYSPARYDIAALWDVVSALRARRFDLAFDCRMDPRANALLAVSGARRRVGYDHGGGRWLLTHALPVNGFERHKSDDWLGLLGPFGGPTGATPPRLVVTDRERGIARSRLRDAGASPRDVILAVHPGASVGEKRWPLDRFAAVLRGVNAMHGVRVVILGDPSGYGSELGRMTGLATLTGTLRELMALLAESQLLLCNDSGPMHLAAALGTPVAAIFRAGNPGWFGPLGTGHLIFQEGGQPVLADDVTRAVRQRLAELARR